LIGGVDVLFEKKEKIFLNHPVDRIKTAFRIMTHVCGKKPKAFEATNDL
jgi:hypothetical protein